MSEWSVVTTGMGMTEKTDEELGKLARIALTAYWSKH